MSFGRSSPEGLLQTTGAWPVDVADPMTELKEPVYVSDAGAAELPPLHPLLLVRCYA